MPDAPATDTATPRTVSDAFAEFLAEEGYRPRTEDADESGVTRVRFKSEGLDYLLFAHEDDPEYFRLGICFELGDGRHAPETLAYLVNHLNDRMKGVKTVLDLDTGDVRFMVECFLCGQRITPALLERSLKALRSTAEEFFGSLRPPERLDS